jgi:hypothetical protein
LAEETSVENASAWPAPAWPAPTVPAPGDPEAPYGPPPPPPPLVPPPPPGAGRRKPARRAIVVGLAVAVIAAVAGIVSSQAPSGPSHPAAWDSRVVDLVKFVEGERRMTFHHPVYVDFLPEGEFRQEMTTSDGELSADDRKEIEQYTGMFRALGLISGDVDLFKVVNQFYGEAALAFYNPVTDRVRVRGTELTVNVRATLVHELTHALQDQYFDLEREGKFPVDGQNDTFRPIFEGDAQRVGHQWVGTLNAADLAAYNQGTQEEADSADLEGVPAAVVQFFAAPYTFGEPFVDVLVSAQGRKAVDDALRDPPHSDAELLDPFRYLEHQGPEVVEKPKLAAGEKKVNDGAFGALALYLVLSQRMEPSRALNAADAWGGDAYVNYVKDGKGCVKADFVGQDAAGTTLLAGVLQVWAGAMPAGTATITTEDGLVHLNSCDPGDKAATTPTGDLNLAVGLAVSRTQMALGMMDGANLSPAQARCSAHHFLAAFSTAELPKLLGATSFDDIPEALATRAGAAARQACLGVS